MNSNSPDANEPRKSITYLTANDLYNINEEVTGALPFVRDRHLLLSAARRPMLQLFGQEQFPTLLDKAAALLESLARHHLFVDGNKRTAIRAVTMFLEANDIRPNWQAQDEYDFVLSVAKGEQELPAIVAWLRANTR
jgi:death-on-curing protein